jgi:hypothetical protein
VEGELVTSLLGRVVGTTSVDDTVLLELDPCPPFSTAFFLVVEPEGDDEVTADRRDDIVRNGGGPPFEVVVFNALTPLGSIEGALCGDCTCEIEMVGR